MFRSLIVLVCLLATAVCNAQSFEKEVVRLVNIERLDADLRELEIHGFLLNGPRLPLKIHPKLTESADWWCRGLKGTGLLVHSWYVNQDGYLILSPEKPTVLNSRVWFPQTGGMTSWLDRERHLGLFPTASSENGVLASSLTADRAAFLWTITGYNDDPRLAIRHYSNLINSRWTHAGVAKGPSGGSRALSFMQFAQFDDYESSEFVYSEPWMLPPIKAK